MAIHPDVFVPPLAVAHLVGLAALFYSLEKVTGCFSRAWRALVLLLGLRTGAAPDDAGSSAPPTPKALPLGRAKLSSRRPVALQHAATLPPKQVGAARPGALLASPLTSPVAGEGLASPRSPAAALLTRASNDWDSSVVARELLAGASGGAAAAPGLHHVAPRWVRGCVHKVRMRGLLRMPSRSCVAQPCFLGQR